MHNNVLDLTKGSILKKNTDKPGFKVLSFEEILKGIKINLVVVIADSGV